MATQLTHASWLKKKKGVAVSADGKAIAIYHLRVDNLDKAALSAWAKHFREHYCLDSKLDRLRQGTGKSRSDFLLDMVFPSASEDFGPATRSGDFAEILVADLLESKFGYWVPRFRYNDKMVRNESPKGTDILGFKLAPGSPGSPSPKDILVAYESKAQMSGAKALDRLQDAVNDSSKDKWRLGESLHALKRRLIEQDKDLDADKVQRFQEGINVPYVRQSGAAAVLCSSVFDVEVLQKTDCSGHENQSELNLIVVHSAELMTLVHSLYKRSANEA